MARRYVVETDDLLGACPAWPAMFSLPPRGETALRRLARYRIGVNEPTLAPSTRAIFSAVILYLPEDAATILVLSNYSSAAGPLPPRGAMADTLRRRTQVRLPAPITLRLNRLIEHAGEETSQRCSRTAIVSSMMARVCHEDKVLWSERFATVMQQPAAAAIPGFDRGHRDESVLRLRRPKAGPRPLVSP